MVPNQLSSEAFIIVSIDSDWKGSNLRTKPKKINEVTESDIK